MSQYRCADDKIYDLIQFDNVPKLKLSDFTEINDYHDTNDIKSCLTNEKRKEINLIKNFKMI